MYVHRTKLMCFCVLLSVGLVLALYFKTTYASLDFVREEVGGLLNLSCLKIDIDNKASYFKSSQNGKQTIYIPGGKHVIQISYNNVYSREWLTQSYELYAEAGKNMQIAIVPVIDKNQNCYSGNWTLAVSSFN